MVSREITLTSKLRQNVLTCESSVRRRRAHLSRPAPAVRVELLCDSCWGPKAPQGRASAHPAGRVSCSQPRRAGKPHSGSVGTVEQSLPNVEVRSHPLAASTGSGIHAGAPRRYTVSGSFSARAAPKMRSFRTARCPCLRRCQQRALPALPCGGWKARTSLSAKAVVPIHAGRSIERWQSKCSVVGNAAGSSDSKPEQQEPSTKNRTSVPVR
jgi:hypothetical protein